VGTLAATPIVRSFLENTFATVAINTRPEGSKPGQIAAPEFILRIFRIVEFKPLAREIEIHLAGISRHNA
jgi:hypothetical protein